MSAPVRLWLKRHDLMIYFLLAYALSWAIEIPIALAEHRVIPVWMPRPAHYLASFGPLVAAVVTTGLANGWEGINGLWRALSHWRVAWRYAFVAVGLPVLVFGLLLLGERIWEGTWPDLALLGQLDDLPDLGILPALGVWLLTFGLGEETGWRGFALPRLQATRSAFSASLLLGALWAAWHLPALFYRETFMALGLLVIPMLLTIATAGAITFTWLYNSTQGSLLMVILFHGLFDFFSASAVGSGSAGVVLTAMMIFLAVRAYKVYGRTSLAATGKVIVAC